uniref:Uncharacterized protein n=1 Tax=Rheinheimera sp. BAL341 TaxID=1708203 RepID=A0A486XK50_9GAMM
MKILKHLLVYLLLIAGSTYSIADNYVVWSKFQMTAELPAPYGRTVVAFLSTEHDDARIVSQLHLINNAGSWLFTDPDLRHIPIDFLTYKGVIPLEDKCDEFKSNCIYFSWQVGEPRYVTFADGTRQPHYVNIDIKLNAHGRFHLKVEDTYQEGLEFQRRFDDFWREYNQKPTERHQHNEVENIYFPAFPAISFPTYFYGSREFFYVLPSDLGKLVIKNSIAEPIVADYQLMLPSGDLVDITAAIKGHGLHFSRFTNHLVSFDNEENTFTVLISCLLNNPEDETRYTAARFTIASNSIISTSFVKQDTQYRVCELKD